MVFEEVIFSLILTLLGLLSTLGKSLSRFTRVLIVTAVLSIVVTINKSILYGMMYFLTFIPALFLQKKSIEIKRKNTPSTIVQKIFSYLSVLPLFGLVLIFKDEISLALKGWTFPDKALFPLEMGLIVVTIYWAIEWSRSLRREER